MSDRRTPGLDPSRGTPFAGISGIQSASPSTGSLPPLLYEISRPGRRAVRLPAADIPLSPLPQHMIRGGGPPLPEVFSVTSRGSRGTERRAHQRGATVRAGATVVRTIMIPSYREDWNFR